MGQHVLPGVPPVEIKLRRSARARRISLRVSRLDGRVTLTMPDGVAETVALDFAHEKGPWLRRQLEDQPSQVLVRQGVEIPFEGKMLRVVLGQGRAVIPDMEFLHVPGNPKQAGARLMGFFKQSARRRLTLASDRYSRALGCSYEKISIRDTRSRWGSCSSNGNLMYSWRLAMAPPDVLEYVAAHEVAHLAEMNHSPAFWRHVKALYGEYETPRRWLREHGHELHRYRFPC